MRCDAAALAFWPAQSELVKLFYAEREADFEELVQHYDRLQKFRTLIASKRASH